MTIGHRLKEERLRLGFSQTDFAALAGASKGAQLKWEKDDASPNAQALVAFAEAGADVLYVLTGRHAPNRAETTISEIEDDLTAIERQLLDIERVRLPGEDDGQADDRTMISARNRLQTILAADAKLLPSGLKERASSLLEIASDPIRLSTFRAADHAQMRKRRDQMKEKLAAWLDGNKYSASDTVKNLLVLLALDFTVPVKLLAEIVEEIQEDVTEQLALD